jgi:hypothetical protein
MDSAVVWMLLVMFTGLLGLLIYVIRFNCRVAQRARS